MDKLTTIITVVSSLAMLLPLALLRYLTPGTPKFVLWGVIALALGLILGCYALAPMGYSVISGELRVHRPIGDKVLNLNQLKTVRRVEPREMRRTIRLLGDGGMFGYYGKMMNPAFGRHTWYATRRGNYVYLEIGDKRFVVTPDDPQQMVSMLAGHVRPG